MSIARPLIVVGNGTKLGTTGICQLPMSLYWSTFVGSSSSHLSSTEAFGNATNDEDPGHNYYAIDYKFTTDLGVHSALV